MTYDDHSFNLIVDKSTIDALLCGDNSFINVAIMTKEIIRTLKVGGIYMIISYGQPENRIFHLVSNKSEKLNKIYIGKRAFII